MSASSTTPATSLPLLFEAHEIAELIGWERRRTQRMLKELGILHKFGGRWCVDRNDLRDRLPPAYRELQRRRAAGELPALTKRAYKKSSPDNALEQPSATTDDQDDNAE